jgi:glycosyltransferase involved in cell wall biosynthesis
VSDFEHAFLAPPPAEPVEPGPVPTFSIVIAAYQAERFIAAALESALAQTLPAREVVVCDDGSTDGTAEAVAPYRDRGVVYLHQENKGEPTAKNVAARAATGDFVVLLDSDDEFLPRRLEALGALAAARPDLDMMTTDAYIEVNGKITRRAYDVATRFDVDDQRKAILRGNFIVGHCAIRRDLYLSIGGFDPAVYTADWDCWIRLILGGARVGLVNEPLALYRVWAGSLSSSRLAYALGHVRTLEKTAARDDLDESERAVLQDSLERRRRTAELTAAEAALADRSPGARRRLLRIALDGRYEGRTRAKAAAAALAARAARRRLRRRTEAGDSRLGRPGY